MNAIVVPFPSTQVRNNEATTADEVARRARFAARVARCNPAEIAVAGEHAAEQFNDGRTAHDAIEAGKSLACALKRRRERNEPTPPRAA